MTDRLLQSIVHPTDFSQAGLDAFAHALRLAVAAKSLFHILHIDRGDELAEWVQFPRVRETLAAWGMIAPDAPRSAVASELGVEVTKAIIEFNNPVRSIGAYVESHPCDLLVLKTHARGAPRWLQGSVAEESGADIVAMPTAGHHGLFDALRGSVTERVLHEAPCPVLAIPVMQEPGAR